MPWTPPAVRLPAAEEAAAVVSICTDSTHLKMTVSLLTAGRHLSAGCMAATAAASDLRACCSTRRVTPRVIDNRVVNTAAAAAGGTEAAANASTTDEWGVLAAPCLAVSTAPPWPE